MVTPLDDESAGEVRVTTIHRDERIFLAVIDLPPLADDDDEADLLPL